MPGSINRQQPAAQSCTGAEASHIDLVWADVFVKLIFPGWETGEMWVGFDFADLFYLIMVKQKQS